MIRKTNLCRILLLTFLLSLTACTPAKIRFAPGDIPPAVSPSQQETIIGEQTKQQLLQKVSISQEPKYIYRLNGIVSRLLGVTPSHDHWKVYVIDAPHWNAMATPGNNIYVFTGIMESLEDDAELAAVLAHEISHGLARHYIPTPEEQLGQLLSGLAGAAVGYGMQQQGASIPETRIISGLASEVTKGFAVNPYSQVKEHEADMIGLFLLADAGYEPEKATKVWYDLAQEGPEGLKFFRTHPPSIERYETLKPLLPKAEERFAAARESRLKRARRLTVEKVPPYQPNKRARRYYQNGAHSLQRRDYVTAAKSFAAAGDADPRFADSFALLGISRARLGDLPGAHESLEKSVQIEPRNGTAHYNLACIQALMGKEHSSVRHLKFAFRQDPSLKTLAKEDPDLNPLREASSFQDLMSSSLVATYQINDL